MGKLISIDGALKDSVGVKNPYRYRGYRYDSETNLYYLQSRYYNPEWGRFVNSDTTDVLKKIGTTNDELTDANLFAYCGNNTINNSDKDGQFWGLVLRFVAAIVAPEAIAAVATIGYLGYLGYDYYRRHNITYAQPATFPQNPDELDKTLGVTGVKVPDGPKTKGRSKTKWKLPSGHV